MSSGDYSPPTSDYGYVPSGEASYATFPGDSTYVPMDSSEMSDVYSLESYLCADMPEKRIEHEAIFRNSEEMEEEDDPEEDPDYMTTPNESSNHPSHDYGDSHFAQNIHPLTSNDSPNLIGPDTLYLYTEAGKEPVIRTRPRMRVGGPPTTSMRMPRNVVSRSASSQPPPVSFHMPPPPSHPPPPPLHPQDPFSYTNELRIRQQEESQREVSQFQLGERAYLRGEIRRVEGKVEEYKDQMVGQMQEMNANIRWLMDREANREKDKGKGKEKDSSQGSTSKGLKFFRKKHH